MATAVMNLGLSHSIMMLVVGQEVVPRYLTPWINCKKDWRANILHWRAFEINCLIFIRVNRALTLCFKTQLHR